MVQRLFQHTGRDQRMSALGYAKTPGTVFIMIHTNLHTFRDDTSTINNRSDNRATLENLTFRQDQ
jgi:hypothetical protein